MCLEILVHDVIPNRQWPQKPPPLGTNERCRVAQGAKPRVLPLKTDVPEGTVTRDGPRRDGRGGRIFHMWLRIGTGTGADPASSPDHPPGRWRAQEGPESPTSSKRKAGRFWVNLGSDHY